MNIQHPWRMAATLAVLACGALPGTALADGGISVGGTTVTASIPAAPVVTSAASSATQAAKSTSASATVHVSASTPTRSARPKPAKASKRRAAKHPARALRTLASTAPNCTTNCADLPLNFVTTNDCTGELVLITGSYHLVATVTTSGNTMTMKAYTNYQESSGVSLTTGTRYQANNTDHQYEKFGPYPAQLDERFDDNYELVSLSPTPNMIVHFAFHMHVDAFGIPSVGVDQVSANCSGAGGTTSLL